MKVAALDLGSNTFLCLICEVEHQTITQVYFDEVEVVRLGQGLSQNKEFHPEALRRAKQTLVRFKKYIDQRKPEKILAMATSAARDAENKDELFKICQELEIPLEIISGDNEAAITFQGAVSAYSDTKTRLVIDIGGGSTEFITGEGFKVSDGFSLNIGCVRLTEKFILDQPTPDEQVLACQQFIQDEMKLKSFSQPIVIDEILAVAGTPTALVTAIIGEYDAKKIDGYELSLDDLLNWKAKLQAATLEDKLKMGIPEGRADVILVGVLILIECLNIYNQNKLTVSTRGVRYGVALKINE